MTVPDTKPAQDTTQERQIRILLLGASGKLGRMTRQIWAEDGLVHDRPAKPGQGPLIYSVARHASGGVDFQWTPGQPTDALPRCDVVVALWGVTRGSAAELAANTQLAHAAMTLAHDIGAQRVLHCSSAAVYGPEPGLQAETARCAPSGAYGLAKQAMEKAIQAHQAGSVSQHVLRIGNVAGAESLFGNMRPGGRVRLDRFANGRSPARSYIAPHDLSQAILALATAPVVPPILNIGAPEPTEMAGLATAAGCTIDWVEAPDTAIPMLGLDTTALSKLVPFSSQASDPAYLVDSARRSGVWP